MSSFEKSKWASWGQNPIDGDASARKYTRLVGPNNQSAILVIVPAENEDYSRFLNVASILNTAGFTVPQLLWSDESNDQYILSDLGQATAAHHLSEHPKDQTKINDSVLDLLVALRDIPLVASAMDANTFAEMLDPLTSDWDMDRRNALHLSMQDAYDQFLTGRMVPSLRDFHAENLIWRPSKSGLDRLGLLDFQDAFVAPEGYDLASYTRDVRRDISPTDQRLLELQFAERLSMNPETLQRQVALLALQRNLRIVGVFKNLIKSGKGRYEAFLPRVWGYIQKDMAHPDLIHFQKLVPTP